jgi:hypothetical protein
MSTETVSWKTGACQASVSRRAIVLRIDVSSISSTSPAGAATAAAGAAFGVATAPRSTSSATIRPSGPLPESVAMSIPFSRASLRASGEALTRPSGRAGASATAAVAASAVAAAASWPRARWSSIPGAEAPSVWASSCSSTAASSDSASAAAGAPPFPEGTSSPSLPMKAIVLPTSTSPESTTIFSRTPSASASTSWVTLSVSSS